jgi:ABC-type multidrug transport system fused ATPase/permease subunit
VLRVVPVRRPGDLISNEREMHVVLAVVAGFLDRDDLVETYGEVDGAIRLEFDLPDNPAGANGPDTGDAPAPPAARQEGDLRMTQSTAVITVRGLCKSYRGVRAVDGIDFDVGPGEVFALLGPNGAGKTTTIEILEGYRHRDAGEVTVLGQDPAHAGAAWRARVGVVLQEATDAGLLTVEETVRHFAGYYPEPRDPDEVIEMVGLAEKRASRVRKLSGGQRRGSTWRWGSSAGRTWYSWTNRPPGSIRKPAAGSGG